MKYKMKNYAMAGFIGAVLFMIGDCLIYVFPGRNPELNMDPVYEQMPIWRFQATTFLGWLGMLALLFGFYSFYAMTKELCGKWIQRITFLSIAGVLGTALAHFNLGALQPYVYKAVLEGGGNSIVAANATNLAGEWSTILNALIIVLFYLQFPVFLYLIISKKAGLSRWFVLLSPFGAVMLGILWKYIFAGSTIAGSWGACESLGEGLLYLTTFFYWKRKGDNV